MGTLGVGSQTLSCTPHWLANELPENLPALLWMSPSLGLLQVGTTVSSFLCGFWESEILQGKVFPTESPTQLSFFWIFYRLIISHIDLNHWLQVINLTFSPTPLTGWSVGLKAPNLYTALNFPVTRLHLDSTSGLPDIPVNTALNKTEQQKNHRSLWRFPGF